MRTYPQELTVTDEDRPPSALGGDRSMSEVGQQAGSNQIGHLDNEVLLVDGEGALTPRAGRGELDVALADPVVKLAVADLGGGDNFHGCRHDYTIVIRARVWRVV